MGLQEIDNLSHYSGSTSLSFLCDITSMSIDQINFICCQLFALFLSYALRKWVISTTSRIWFTLLSGIFICLFCFGVQTFHIIASAGLNYLIIKNIKGRFMPWIVLVVSMIYLSALHLKRQFVDNAGYSIDITGPMMILTQKLTSLAFSLHDAHCFQEDENEKKKERKMSEIDISYFVYEVPGTLEFISYVFQFQSMLAGPLIFYEDYHTFIFNKEEVPSPTSEVATKLIKSVFFAIVFLNFGPNFNCQTVRQPTFLDDSSGIYKMLYLTLATTIERCKYYHAWILADAVCNMSGLGYNKKSGTWDLVTNVHAFTFELGLNLKESLDRWNIGTMKWLRRVVYMRAPLSCRTHLVYALSAIWHGFYPGYYITFLSGALFTEAARAIRRYVRPIFLSSKQSKAFYDLSTWLVTRMVLAYVTFAFVIQDFFPSIAVYSRLYFFYHILGLFSIVLVPSLFAKSERETSDGRITERLTPLQATQSSPLPQLNESQSQQGASKSKSTTSLNFHTKVSKLDIEAMSEAYKNMSNEKKEHTEFGHENRKSTEETLSSSAKLKIG